jgi:hypothetical protein
VEKLLFNEGFISDLIFLGKADKHFFDKHIGLQKVFAAIVKLPNISWVQNNLVVLRHKSEPRT